MMPFMFLTLILVAWAGFAWLGFHRRAGCIVSVGGGFIGALLVFCLAGLLVTKPISEDEVVTVSSIEKTALAVRDALPPPELQGHSIEEVEQLYRRLCVHSWNGNLYLEGRGLKLNLAEIAEAWEIHVDLLHSTYQYMDARVRRASGVLAKEFESDTHIKHALVKSTAWGGSYTFEASLYVVGNPKDPGLQEETRQRALALRKRLPPFCSGFKITNVTYHWPQTGTSGSMNLGFVWKRQTDDFRVMNGTRAMLAPKSAMHEDDWSQPSWNDGRPVEE